MNSFTIVILHQRRYYRMQVEQLQAPAGFERFKIYGKSKFLVVQGNRLLIRGKGLKHRRIDWKLLEGQALYRSAMDDILVAIEKKIDV